MKKISLYAIALLASVMMLGFSSCGSDDVLENEKPASKDEVKVYFVYTLDTSSGTSMNRAPAKAAKTNAEVFDEFYTKIKSGELVASSYELTLTEVSTGATYTFNGNWNSHDLITLNTGTYHVVGKSTAEGESIQEKCSFVFDEVCDINVSSSMVTLHATYDCFLLIFNSTDIQTLQNHNGTILSSFSSLGTSYKYAFVKDQLYQTDKKSDAYILGKYTDGAEFKVFTGNLEFEKGKYYVYNSVSNGFDLPEMEEGNVSNHDVITVNVKGISFNMVYVEGGTFQMGATTEQGSDAKSDENPVHQVTLSSYYIGTTEVTQELWEIVMGSNPSEYKGSNLPVENVYWDDCQEFIKKLNAQTEMNFRLPTEAEWEYAARGGGKSLSYKYSGSNTLGDVAWYLNNCGTPPTHPVGTKQANELGLYDMSGNVWEWCQDWYGSYSSSAQTNPTGASSGTKRVSRGGGWSSDARHCRVSCRISNMQSYRLNDLGLRLVLSSSNAVTDPEETEPETGEVDDINITSYISASFVGGSIMSVSGTIQNGSQLSFKFTNGSSKDVILNGINLINGETGYEGNFVSTDNVTVKSGGSKTYTLTVGALGIKSPICRFTYTYNGTQYTVSAAYTN